MKISISSGRFFFFVLILVSSSIILVRCNTLAGRIGGLSDAEMKELVIKTNLVIRIDSSVSY